MEFLVEFEVNVPEGTPESNVGDREKAVVVAAAGLARKGHFVSVWKATVATDGVTRADALQREPADELPDVCIRAGAPLGQQRDRRQDLPGRAVAALEQPRSEALAASMRADWANFAANGDPSTPGLPWPTVDGSGRGMLLVTPQPQLDSSFAARHHCSVWAAG